ncbi:hypothetical protein ACFL55_02320 [Candidatus Latescibacterota bacterium]
MFRRTKTGIIVILALMAGFFGFASPGGSLTSDLFATDIQWNLSINDILIQSTSLPVGDEFILNAEITAAPGSDELIEALNGIQFRLEPIAATGKLTIDLTFNVQGNSFSLVPGYNSFFYMDVEMSIDGRKTDNTPFTLVMTIPRNTLSFLLDSFQISHGEEVGFAYYFGGTISPDGIETFDQVQGLVVHITEAATVIGASRSDLGIPASVGYSTWYKIKKLFE